MCGAILALLAGCAQDPTLTPRDRTAATAATEATATSRVHQKAIAESGQVAELANALRALAPDVDAAEAQRAAATAFSATRELAVHYRMAWPPELHNMLVNAGLRDRGLCCHWAADMNARLHALDLRSLETHWVVAHRGSALREHNSAMLTPRGGGLHNGIVIDGWRRAGKLTWVAATTDRYPWRLHARSGQWQRLRCISDLPRAATWKAGGRHRRLVAARPAP